MHTDIPKELASDPWYKVADFLQQNWAVIIDKGDFVLTVFYGDTCGVFDEMEFSSKLDAERSLTRNGFKKYASDSEVHDFIGLPIGDFKECPHPNGRIYSSGRYWN